MKIGLLFSGGKDSVYAGYLAQQEHEVVCLITLRSKNKESYMFHTPNIDITALQAKALDIPHLIIETEGEKEKELEDLKNAIARAQQEFKIEGIVTGAIESVYQGSRVQNICDQLNLWCFNPLWKKEQVHYLKELVENKFEVLIIGVFAYPFDDSWLGRKIDETTISELTQLAEKYKINPSGEGGEIETLVIDAPHFKKQLTIKTAHKEYENHAGVYCIEECEVQHK